MRRLRRRCLGTARIRAELLRDPPPLGEGEPAYATPETEKECAAQQNRSRMKMWDYDHRPKHIRVVEAEIGYPDTSARLVAQGFVTAEAAAAEIRRRVGLLRLEEFAPVSMSAATIKRKARKARG